MGAKLTMAIDQIDAMSLQPLETPPLRVSRPVAACSRCRNAKIKCDGKLPACTSCEKNGRAAECTSTNDQFARGKERSYVSTLETRIDKLEAKIREAQARKPSVVSNADNETPVPSRRPSEQIRPVQQKPTVKDEVPTPTTGRRRRRREVSAIDDLVSDFGFLSVNATARDFHGFTSAMSYARLILWSCSKDELPKGTSKALPARKDGVALVQFYLNNVFALLPAFDEAFLWSAVERVYSRHSTSLDHWIVRMVFAISNASVSRRSGDQPYLESISHVCAALDYAEQVLQPGNISGIQALLLLAEFAMLAPHHFDSWQLIGAASRAMTDLGYHQDPPRGSQMDRNRLDLRRKVFYCIYVLDRSTSLVQTRAFSFSDASSNVKVPYGKPNGKTSVSSNTSAPSPTPSQHWLQSHGQAFDLVELRKIQSAWYTELFQTNREAWNEPYPELWRMCDEMRNWFDNLSPGTPQHMRQFFELDLLYSYVYVLSPSSRVPRIHQFAQKLIFEYCIRYTDLMLQLLTDPAYTVPLTFYDAMRVYMTGRQFIDVLSHSIDLLLSGAIPQHPEVKPSAAPPPAMPVVPLPPGETLQRSNTCRAINCIKQTMDCMGKFGSRFGYMSWQQRYEHESKAMLDNLEHRLHVLDGTDGARGSSTWGSNDFIPTSNGNEAYRSPPQITGQGPTRYQQQLPQMPPTQPGYGEAGMLQQTSPPLYHQQATLQPLQQYSVQQGVPYGQVQPQYHQTQNQSQPVQFSNPSHRPQSFSTAPGQQFAAWSGHGGFSAGPNPLNQETAGLYGTDTNQNLQSIGSPAGARHGSMHQAPPSAQSNYVATFEPMPRSLIVRDPLRMSVDENIPPEQYRHHSVAQGLQTLPTVNWPSFGSMGQISPGFDPTAMAPPAVPPRRTSMQDASQDLLRATYPPTQPVPPQAAGGGERLPRIFSPGRFRNKGKGRAVKLPCHPPPPAGEVVGLCRWDPGFGYVCEMCSRICVDPSRHRVGLDGTSCVDLSVHPLPHLEAVREDVMRDPERAMAEAEATRQRMGLPGSPLTVQYPGYEGIVQAVEVAGEGSRAKRGVTGSSSGPLFTASSRIMERESSGAGQQAALSSEWLDHRQSGGINQGGMLF